MSTIQATIPVPVEITLSEARFILTSASALILCGRIVDPCISEITGDDENEFMYGEYDDSDCYMFSYKFSEGMNRMVKMDLAHGSLTLIDTDGDEVEVGILVQKIIR